MRTVLFYLDFALAPAAALALGIYHAHEFGFTLQFVGLFLLGWVLWTFLEFVIHRMAHEAEAFKKEHFFHHRKPLAYTGPSSFWTALTYGAVGATAGLVLGPLIATGIMSGLMFGYGFYITLHALIHRAPKFPLGIFHPMRDHHERHHKGKPHTFGVTTKFWDWLYEKLCSLR